MLNTYHATILGNRDKLMHDIEKILDLTKLTH